MSADSRPAYVAAIAAVVLLLDQAVKVFIKLGFSLTERVTWIPGAFDIQFIETSAKTGINVKQLFKNLASNLPGM